MTQTADNDYCTQQKNNLGYEAMSADVGCADVLFGTQVQRCLKPRRVFFSPFFSPLYNSQEPQPLNYCNGRIAYDQLLLSLLNGSSSTQQEGKSCHERKLHVV